MDNGMPEIVIVAGVGQNRELGRNGDLIWKHRQDLRHFKQTTMGQAIIMGRKTFESIGRALPGRQNIVVTRQGAYAAPEPVEVVGDLDAALEQARVAGAQTAFVIGGSEIYSLALGRAHKMLLSEFAASCEQADTYFPAWDQAEWVLTAEQSVPEEGGQPGFCLREYVSRRDF